MAASSYKERPTCGEFAWETTGSSTRSTTTHASWTSASYGTGEMPIGSVGSAPNFCFQPDRLRRRLKHALGASKNYVLGRVSEGFVEAPAEPSQARRRPRPSC